MAINTYDGTTSGSDSGWTRRYVSEFSGTDGHAWRVEIIDSESAAGTFSQSETAVTDMVLADGGFLIEYDGDNDNRRTPLVASSCTLQLICTESEHFELVDAIHANKDHRFGIAVFVFEPDGTDGTGGAELFADGNGWWRPFWFGTIFADQGEADYLKTQANFTLTAQCGLALLNDEQFVQDNGDPFTDEATLAQMIGRCMDKLPTKSLWGWNDYDGSTAVNRDFNQTHVDRALAQKPRVPMFRECVWIFDKEKHNGGDVSVLDHTKCSSMAFLEIAESKDQLGGIVRTRNYVSCSQVLEHVAAVLGARMFLSDGSWWFQNMDAMFNAVYDRHEFVYFDIYHLKTGGSANQANTPLENSVAGSVLDLYGKGYSFTDEVKVNVLFPVRIVESIHVEGGSRQLAGVETAQTEYESNVTGNTTFGWEANNVGIFFDKVGTTDEWVCQKITFENEGATIEGGQNITIQGAINFHNLGQDHWSNNDVNSANAKGMRYFIKMKIKCGDYYLKRNVTNRSETAPIKNAVGTTIRTQNFHTQDGDVEWTTDESTYKFSLPRMGGDPEAATVELSDSNGPIDFDFTGGFHTENRGGNNTDEFKCVEGIGNTMYGTYNYDLNWTLPELPTGGVHEGVSLEFDMVILNSENNMMQGTAVRDILDSGGAGGSFGVGVAKEIGFLNDLQILYADGTSDVEVKFISLVDDNTTSIVTAESVLGDKYTETQTNRALKVLDSAGGAYKWADGKWVTLDEATEDGKLVHQLLADETMEKRHKPLEIRTAEIAFTELGTVNPLSTQRGNHNAANWCVPTFARVFKVANTNGVNEWFSPLEMSFTPFGSEFTLCFIKSARTVGSITNFNNVDLVRGPQGGSGGRPLGPPSPLPTTRNPRGGGDTTTAIAALRRSVLGNAIDVDAVQTKTDFITVGSGGITGLTIQTGSTPIRAENVLTNPNRVFATNAQLLQIAQNQLTASGNTSSVLTNASNISSNASNIASTSSVANAANSRSVTNESNISTNTSAITSIEAKTDLLTVTSSLNLDLVKNKTNTITINPGGQITALNFNSSVVILDADQVSQNGTNKFTTAANNTKLGHITVGQAVNLDTMEGNIATLISDVAVLAAQADTDSNSASERGGQTGVEVATFSASGVLGSISDGSAGQFLKTDGSGNLSFADAGGGWHGSATLMKIFPTEFMGNDVGRAIVMTYIEDDNAGELALRINQSTGTVFAMNEIPTGYKATHVQVYTDTAVTNGVEVFSFNQTTGAISSVGTGNTNASIDITDVTSSATAALVVQVTPGSTTVDVFGADVTIATT